MLSRPKPFPLEERLKYIGPSGSVVLDTTLNNLFLQDGITRGGYAIHNPVNLEGPDLIPIDTTTTYRIVDYDSFSHYEVTVDRGIATLEGEYITLSFSELTPIGMLDMIVKKNGVGNHYSIPIDGNTGPGPNELLGGDMTAGFYGEVDSEEFITYGDLSILTNVLDGTLINNNESMWLKFSLDGRILFVAKKPIRHSISWDNINSKGAVFGELEIDVQGYAFICRLFKGASSDPTPMSNFREYDPPESQGSEWNRLMYPVHSGVHHFSGNPTTPEMGTWAQYSDRDLIVNNPTAGNNSWCQETSSGNSRYRLLRGYRGITRYAGIDSYHVTANTAWRPVLELIP